MAVRPAGPGSASQTDTVGGGAMDKNHNGIGTALGNGLTGSDLEGLATC